MIAAGRHGHDVIVLGGGPAGCATALALAGEGVERLLVVESTGYERERVGESIPPDTRQPLAQLGLLEAFRSEGHAPCPGSCSSWGDDALGYNDFVFNPHGHGWHLDRRRFDAFLGRAVRERGVELWTNTRVLAAERTNDDGAELLLADAAGRRIAVSARVVVDATGGRARFARRLGARRRQLDELTTATGYFELPDGQAFPALTMLEAVEYGWWYAARLPGRRIAVVVATSAELFRRLALRLERRWLETLAATRHVGPALADCRPVRDSLGIRPTTSHLLEPAYGEWGTGWWLAVGDAASSYDPISSQGIYKALDHGLAAGRAIAACLDGEVGAFAAYADRIEHQFGEYQAQRAYFYDLERRWPNAAFWMERCRRKLEPAHHT